VLYHLRDKDKPKFSRGYVLDKRNNLFEASSEKLSSNLQETIYTWPAHKGRNHATCFSPFSEYDIQENLSLERCGVNRDSLIDPNSILTCIRGETPLQTFLDQESVL
jgi:hypothetical protein